MKFRIAATVCAIALGLFSGVSFAKESTEHAITAQSQAQFELQSAAVRAQLKAGGHYEFVNAAERGTIERRLYEIGAIIARHTDPAQFTDKDKADLLVAQEDVNAILTKNDGRRLVCERRAPTGSHLGQDKCRTVADIERERRETRKNVGDRQRQPSTPSGLPNKQGD
ncbi:MAG: hypothetical protein ABI411_00120 [Tahibacter sp.]